ncbi:hypothetical protein [Shinella zoogloeoides]|uniref:hypothetical protein n=1 Tax=Shinella zoogloeoides TaxID=352475 RepID=UPI0028A8641C|nr:hypothetical protein [Shinella zoogloeoides]
MTFYGTDEQLTNALRETAARLSGTKAAICEAAAERLEATSPTIDKPARVGNAVFRPGVSTQTVIHAAQRCFQHMQGEVPAGLRQDVINLVIAAREFWEVNEDTSLKSYALDKALEAFAERVPYENEPDVANEPKGGDHG